MHGQGLAGGSGPRRGSLRGLRFGRPASRGDRRNGHGRRGLAVAGCDGGSCGRGSAVRPRRNDGPRGTLSARGPSPRDVSHRLQAPRVSGSRARGRRRLRRRRSGGRRDAAPLRDGRCAGDGTTDVPQRRRRRRAGREPGRDRRRLDAGGGDGRTDRAAPDGARRGRARDGAGCRHQPALGRRQGEPVLPARVQPRSWNRLRDDGRGRPGQSSDARPRPRLHRPQLRGSGARLRHPVQEGPLLRRGRRLHDRRLGQHQLRQRPRRAHRAGRWRLVPVSAGPLRGFAESRRRQSSLCDRRRLQQRPLAAGRRLSQVQRRPPLQRRRRPQRVRGHADGLQRELEIDRPGPGARRRRRLARPVRHGRPDRRRRVAALLGLARVAALGRGVRDASRGVRRRLLAGPLLQLHLLPRRSGPRRPVRAARRPQRLRPEGDAPLARELVRVPGRQRGGRAGALRRHPPDRPLPHGREASGSRRRGSTG